MEKIKGIRLVGPLYDGSGYGSCARSMAKSLHKQEIPFCLHPVSFERDRPDLKEEAEFLNTLVQTQIPFNVNLVRLSPEIAVNFIVKDALNICNFSWETTRLHPEWVNCCNKFDILFVDCDWTAKCIKESGVNVPVFSVPIGTDVSKYQVKEIPNLDGTYKFYTIQQWTERKNGLGLLKAYFRAFSAEDNVQLILKSYMSRVDFNQAGGDKIKGDIQELKRSMQMLKEYPPIYLVNEKLTDDAVVQMHQDCDCYVLLDRGEGYGIPLGNAAAVGNPIIASDFGGSRQFLNKENSYCVSGIVEPVFNMAWSKFYTGEQDWFYPSVLDAAEKMRYVYENRQEAFEMGKKARASIEQYDLDKVGNILVSSIHQAMQLRG